MRRGCRIAVTAACLAVLATGCTTTDYTIPNSGTIIPSGNVNISPTVSYTLEQIAMALAAGLVLNAVYQPMAPNWSIEEAILDDNTYYLRLQAKRFRIGGDGEAMMVLKRRARQLQYERGYAGYRILDYNEGVESNTPIAQRYSEGIVQLVRVNVPAGGR
jgi:hypothetical protein